MCHEIVKVFKFRKITFFSSSHLGIAQELRFKYFLVWKMDLLSFYSPFLVYTFTFRTRPVTIDRVSTTPHILFYLTLSWGLQKNGKERFQKYEKNVELGLCCKSPALAASLDSVPFTPTATAVSDNYRISQISEHFYCFNENPQLILKRTITIIKKEEIRGQGWVLYTHSIAK